MNRYVVGEVVFLEAYLTDPATGDPHDPTTQDPCDDPTIVLTVFAPDGTNSVASLTHVSTGTYTAHLTANQVGQWEYATNSTGAAASAAKERFFVSPVP
ncbi:MAG: hypothetical protein V4529_17390 [Gemmatimonadota bacterium]